MYKLAIKSDAITREIFASKKLGIPGSRGRKLKIHFARIFPAIIMLIFTIGCSGGQSTGVIPDMPDTSGSDGGDEIRDVVNDDPGEQAYSSAGQYTMGLLGNIL